MNLMPFLAKISLSKSRSRIVLRWQDRLPTPELLHLPTHEPAAGPRALHNVLWSWICLVGTQAAEAWRAPSGSDPGRW